MAALYLKNMFFAKKKNSQTIHYILSYTFKVSKRKKNPVKKPSSAYINELCGFYYQLTSLHLHL